MDDTTGNNEKREENGVSDENHANSDSGAKASCASTTVSNKLKLLQIVESSEKDKVKSEEDAKKRNYAFWSTQPVPQIGTSIQPEDIGPIEPDKPTEEIRSEPYSLPGGFCWETLDLQDPSVLEEVYKLLTENYVEDDDNMFRFDYSPEFLRWALQPPDYVQDWHVGVRTTSSTRKLVGFISGVPATIQVFSRVQKMAEINFLCVHKKLRAKRVTPVLIREITRRVNKRGIFQAVYTAGVFLPTPFATARYYHRSLNPKKLVETGFSGLRKNQTLQRLQKLYKLPQEPKTTNLRKVEDKDFSALTSLINSYLSQFSVAPVFTETEVRHWFNPVDNVVYCYVVEDSNSTITDMLSFYHLPSQVMNNPKHKAIKAAYSFYNVHTETPLTQIMNDALILAKQDGFDVFNCLNIMTNSSFVEDLKFGIGDGNLQFYFYNFKCPKISHELIGLVLQ